MNKKDIIISHSEQTKENDSSKDLQKRINIAMQLLDVYLNDDTIPRQYRNKFLMLEAALVDTSTTPSSRGSFPKEVARGK